MHIEVRYAACTVTISGLCVISVPSGVAHVGPPSRPAAPAAPERQRPTEQRC